jgi:hypothetical protein
VSEQVSALFVRLSELADAEGAVPEDGSGVDGVWTTDIPARDRDRDWTVAMNADLEGEQAVQDVPRDGMESTIAPGRATVWLGAMPAGVLSPHGGQLAVDVRDGGPQSIEDELIADVEARIAVLEVAADE